MKLKLRNSTIAVTLVMLLAFSSVIGAAAGGDLDWSADPAPNLEFSRTETKAVHNMSWGNSDSALRKYEDNSGNLQTMEARVNQSADNPITVTPTDIQETDFGQFPNAKSDVSALDSTEWTVGGTNSTKGSTSDVTTAPSTEAVRLQTDGTMGSGDDVKFTFSNFTITSDEKKHYIALGQDIATLDSATAVEYRVVDEDGDYVTAEVNSSRSSGEDFVTNATGEGYIYQVQIGTLVDNGHLTDSDGDGFDNIGKVEVVVTDGDFDGSVSMLNLDKKSPYDFGAYKANTDDDDELETVDRTEKKTAGAMKLHSLETLGSTFDDAVLHSVSIDMIEEPADQPDSNVWADFNESDKFPGYHGTVKIAVRMTAEDSYDRSIAGGVIRDVQSVTSDRLLSVEYAEGVASDEEVDKKFVEDASLSDITSQYGSEGKEVQVDTSTSQGSSSLTVYEFKLTETQFNALQSASGGGGGSGAQTSGGLGSIPIIGGLLVFVMGLLRKFGG